MTAPTVWVDQCRPIDLMTAGARSGAHLLETHLRRELAGLTAGDILPVGIARDRWRTFRREHVGDDGVAYGTAAPDLLTAPESQPKTGRNEIPTWILHLLPVDQAGGANVCPWATSCANVCLVTSGHGVMSNVRRGRMARTRFLEADPIGFVSLLWANIGAKYVTVTRRKRIADTIGMRLNGTSDLRWERIAPAMFDTFSDVTFYDYTKAPAGARSDLPPNYHLTASATERDSVADIVAKAHAFGRVAVVIDTPATPKGKAAELPATWAGLPTVDGDVSDWRLEPGPVVILLRAKADAIGDTSGFVRPTWQEAP